MRRVRMKGARVELLVPMHPSHLIQSALRQPPQPIVVDVSSAALQINIYQPLQTFAKGKNLELVDLLLQTRSLLATTAADLVDRSFVETGGEEYAHNVSEDAFLASMSSADISERHELCTECNSISLLGAGSALDQAKGTPRAYRIVLEGLKREYEQGAAEVMKSCCRMWAKEIVGKVREYEGVGWVYINNEGLLVEGEKIQAVGHRHNEANWSQVEDYDPANSGEPASERLLVKCHGHTGIISKMSASSVRADTGTTEPNVATTSSNIVAMAAVLGKRPASADGYGPVTGSGGSARDKRPRLS
ncbi:hypothetical protein EJ03DRAFT_80084 [Teratosphaeria nubilosa]|uniref:Uncharacterized protein n=1 Tax=Teratosphaeria nubilosa TaxID=161662 RepID=A0A6G1LC03_9PEZI|nr:hypothetical protein EJ03DRAFT_80084 [Teratosphaeria nubilosa]